MGLRKKLKKLNKKFDALELKRMKIETKQDKIGKRINKLEDKHSKLAAISEGDVNKGDYIVAPAPPKKKNSKRQTPINT